MALARSLIPWFPGKQKRRPVTPAEQCLCDVKRTRTERGAPRCWLPKSEATWSPEIAMCVRRGCCPLACVARGSAAARRQLHLDPQRELWVPLPCPAQDSLNRTWRCRLRCGDGKTAADLRGLLPDSKRTLQCPPTAPGPELVPRSPQAWRAQKSPGAVLCPGRGRGWRRSLVSFFRSRE